MIFRFTFTFPPRLSPFIRLIRVYSHTYTHLREEPFPSRFSLPFSLRLLLRVVIIARAGPISNEPAPRQCLSLSLSLSSAAAAASAHTAHSLLFTVFALSIALPAYMPYTLARSYIHIRVCKYMCTREKQNIKHV